MFEINLVPNVKLKLLQAQKLRNIVIFFSVITAIVVVGIVVVMFLVLGGTKITSSIMSNNITSEFDKISSRAGISETLTLQNQMENIGALSNSKQVPSRLFAFLDVSLPANDSPYFVTLSNLNYNASTGLVTLEGQSSGGYPALDAFMKTIELVGYRFVPDFNEQLDADLDENALKARLSPSTDQEPIIILSGVVAVAETSYGRNADGGLVLRFNINFTLNQDVFDFNKKHVVIEGPTRQIVTDSYVQIRDNIFEAGAQDCAPEDTECRGQSRNQNGGI